MEFENIEEIQTLLDKTSSFQKRLETSLLLIEGKIAELGQCATPLIKASDKLQILLDKKKRT